jgi:acyl-CoA synthetase (AMP-forming)/AMP-acid ligase II
MKMSMNDSLKSLVDILQWRSTNQPNKRIYRFLQDGEDEERTMTLGELNVRAKSIASELQKVASKGERGLILLPAGLDFIVAKLGCLCAGIIAVPVPPPHHLRIEKSIHATLRIINDAKPSLVLLHKNLSEAIKRSPQLASKFNGIHFIEFDEDLPDTSSAWRNPDISEEDIAFLQYTSGSTSAPKGVMISHKNLMSNLHAIERSMGLSETNESVFWLPPYHDMGLIGGILQPLYSGFTVTLIPHLLFLQKPVRWLNALSKYEANTSGAPNFAYELCLKKVTPEQRDQLDLSKWEIAMNGAEAVNLQTMEKFRDYFAPCGFQQNAFAPCYGLAEATLMISSISTLDTYHSVNISRTALKENKVVFHQDETDLQTIVGCGKCIDDHQLKIVDPITHLICQKDEIGEIWFRGPSVAQGYRERVLETECSFGARIQGTNDGPFLRTGDLGFMADGQLFVTGRIKNLIIIDGKNFYPHDIEKAVQDAHFAIEPMGTAAISSDKNGSEHLIILVETRTNSLFSQDDLISAIRKTISENFSLSVEDIQLVPRGFIPRTTSGKIKHHECKMNYLLNHVRE